jgi:transposase InsO family protein
MPWSDTSPMDERARFVLDAFSDCFTMTELCERYGISRKTGYKWIERYKGGGDPACADESRAPRTHPNATPEDVVELIVQLRGKYPDAGPRTLLWHLEKLDARRSWPSPSTIGEILKRHDLIKPRRRRRPRMTWSQARTLIDAPNQVWTADFKGQFRLRNGLLCYPLTILDGHTRFLLTCRALKTTATEPARRGFEAAFEEFGLPSVIRTDNGVPFAAPSSVLGLSGLSVWLLKLGIRLERSRPGKPQDNGAHERMHRTLKAGACRPPRGTFSAQQRALNEFRRIYNEERPHHALGMQTPASLYQSSERAYPGEAPDPVYPPHFERRRITKIGVFSWHRQQIFVTEALRNETLGFEWIADGLWSVFFGEVLLGRFDEENSQFLAGMSR